MSYTNLPNGRPFGIAADTEGVFVSTDHGVTELRVSDGKPVASAELPAATRSGFTGITTFGGAAWVANYDRGELYPIAR